MYGLTDERVELARAVMALPGFGWGWPLIGWGWPLIGRTASGHAYVVLCDLGDGVLLCGDYHGESKQLASMLLLDVTDPGNAARLRERVGGRWWLWLDPGNGYSAQHASVDSDDDESGATECEAVCRVLLRLGRAGPTP